MVPSCLFLSPRPVPLTSVIYIYCRVSYLGNTPSQFQSQIIRGLQTKQNHILCGVLVRSTVYHIDRFTSHSVSVSSLCIYRLYGWNHFEEETMANIYSGREVCKHIPFLYAPNSREIACIHIQVYYIKASRVSIVCPLLSGIIAWTTYLLVHELR